MDLYKIGKDLDSQISHNIEFNLNSVAVAICMNKISLLLQYNIDPYYDRKGREMLNMLRKKLNADKKVNFTGCSDCYTCGSSKRNLLGGYNIYYIIEGSNIEIANDYNGGIDRALSAEKGKELFGLVTNIDSKTY